MGGEDKRHAGIGLGVSKGMGMRNSTSHVGRDKQCAGPRGWSVDFKQEKWGVRHESWAKPTQHID